VSSENTRICRVVAVGSGRGGAGKTLIAANVGVYLAQIGKKVVLVDLNWTSPALHVALGIEFPSSDIGSLIGSRTAEIHDIVTPTNIPGLEFIAGPGDYFGISRNLKEIRENVSLMLASIEADYMLVDLPPGIDPAAVYHFAQASVPVVMIRPEPSSVEQTYRFISAVYLERFLGMEGLEENEREEIRQLVSGGINYMTPLDLCSALSSIHGLKEKAERIRHQFMPCIIVNDTRLSSDMELAESMVSVCGRRLGIRLVPLGHVEHDDTVIMNARRLKPFIIEQPGAKASKNLEKIVRRLLVLESGDLPDPPPLPSDAYTYYDTLEIYPGATEDEVRTSYRKLRDIYSPGSLAASGILNAGQHNDVMRQIEEAYVTLSDPMKRRRYDRMVFPDGLPARPPKAASINRESAEVTDRSIRLEPPEIDPDVEITGSLLRTVREEMRIELAEISQRTKISNTYLNAIEEESYDDLPALVYTRGFVFEMARYLRMDPHRAARDYAVRFRDYLRSHHRLDE